METSTSRAYLLKVVPKIMVSLLVMDYITAPNIQGCPNAASIFGSCPSVDWGLEIIS